MSDLLKIALWYRNKMGFSVFPVRHDKKPYIKWEKYQKELATLDEITSWWSKWPDANIGIATGQLSNLTVIDIDEPKALAVLNELVPDSFSTPICTTPSGGQHWYCSYLPGSRNTTRFIDGADTRSEGGYVVAPPSINGTSKKYEWMQDLKVGVVTIACVPQGVQQSLDFFNNSTYNTSTSNIYNTSTSNIYNTSTSIEKGQLLGQPIRDKVGQNRTKQDNLTFDEPGRDDTLFHIANCLTKGGMSGVSIEQCLERLALTCSPPFPKDELKTKILSAEKRLERKNSTFSQYIRDWVSGTWGDISGTDADISGTKWDKTGQGGTKENFRKVMQRLCHEGIVERIPGRNGWWRKINNETNKIDFLNCSGDEVSVRWPLGLERYFQTMPKNICVVAGSPDAGKTAFLLNFVKMNMSAHKIKYFSSEMGALEIKSRLLKFDIPISKWNFECLERSSNFSDVVDPNGINVIDYLEIHDNFYQVSGLMKAIHDKLDRGICLIALQKKRGSALGRGAESSLEKPRLYLSMDTDYPGQVVTIQKCKNWRDNMINPNGLQCRFKLVGGAKIIMIDEWERLIK